MKIIKVISVLFEKQITNIENFKYLTNNILIRFHSFYKPGKVEYLTFTAELSGIEFSIESNDIKIHNVIINKVNKNLEDVMNMISLSSNSGKRIFSTSPSIFLESENPKDTLILNSITKISIDPLVNIAIHNLEHEFDLDFCQRNLNDRLEGVKIYSEAIFAKTSSGKFREYIRFFEKAFKSSNSGLIKPLSAFLLTNSKLNYDRLEIENWINKRNKSIHANCRDGFLIDREVASLVPRIQQAVIDILFNKTNWADKSNLRRNLFEFKKGIRDSENNIFLAPSSTENLSLMYFDESKTFPVNFEASFNPTMIPPQWWYQKESNYVIKSAVRIQK